MSSDDTILTDRRPIQGLWLGDDEGTHYIASETLSIEAYGENGEFCAIPWFRIKDVNGVVRQRIPAHRILTVQYAPQPIDAEGQEGSRG